MSETGANPPLVELINVAKTFDVSPPWLNRVLEGKPRALLRAVAGVDLAIARGETFALVGESGCGKSTVARLIVGLHQPTRGEIRYEGKRIDAGASQALRRNMQMIFQDPYASLNPRWHVSQIVAEPLRTHPQMLSLGKRDFAERVASLLQQVGLAAADGEKFPHQFSGGQRQRISIARALAGEPAFLVCDEPTSALDVSVQAQVLNLMRKLQRELGLTFLFISHNLAVVHHIADRVAVMYLGRIVERAPTKRLFSEPQHPYTRMLLDAVPDLELSGKARTAVAGEVPNPLAPPAGCAFHPRCPYANERCRREVPVLKPVYGWHGAATDVACHAVEEGRLKPRVSATA